MLLCPQSAPLGPSPHQREVPPATLTSHSRGCFRLLCTKDDVVPSSLTVWCPSLTSIGAFGGTPSSSLGDDTLVGEHVTSCLFRQ